MFRSVGLFIKKYRQLINRDETDITARIFLSVVPLFAVSSLAIALFYSYKGISYGMCILMMISALIFLLSFGISIKTLMFDKMALVLCVYFAVVLSPGSFFLAGGTRGNGYTIFLIGCAFAFMTLRGENLVVAGAMNIISAAACIYIYHKVGRYSWSVPLRYHYLSMALMVIVTGLLISVMFILHEYMYEKTRKISLKQRNDMRAIINSQNSFFSSMSHELRTPINTILGLNELNLKENVDEDIREAGVGIESAGRTLLGLINDLLDMSKLRLGKMNLVNSDYDIAELISEVVNSTWETANEKGLYYRVYLDPLLPGKFNGDEIKLRSILGIMILNAINNTVKGGIELNVRYEKKEEDTAALTFEIKDTGIGIRREDICEIFNVFSRQFIDNNSYSSGLGLAIARQMVELMGGEISVDSIYTQGSTFRIVLDQKVLDERLTAKIGAGTRHLINTSSSEKKNGKNFKASTAKILVVDDDAVNRAVAANLLEPLDIKADLASGGEEAIKCAAEKKYDIIFMDHLMPLMDGIEALKNIREDEAGLNKETPVIAMTANAGSDIREFYMEKKFSGYLSKPVNPELLKACILKYLPEEAVEFTDETDPKERDRVYYRDYGKRSVSVTTDSVADISEEDAKRYGINILNYYIHTSKGKVFKDKTESGVEALLEFMGVPGNRARSEPPSVEEYQSFFAKELLTSEHVIHIAMAKGDSEGYKRALEAAGGFANVDVYDSGSLSRGMGRLVLIAAGLAMKGKGYKEILKAVGDNTDNCEFSFLLMDTELLAASGRLSGLVHRFCKSLLLHPVISLKNSKMYTKRIETGNEDTAAKRYIKNELSGKVIKSDWIVIIYVGIDFEQREKIREDVLDIHHFKYVHFVKASAAIALNCGYGTFGLMYEKED